MSLKTPALLTAIVFLSFMSFSSCGMMGKGDKKDSTGTTVDKPADDVQNVVINGDYSMGIPKHMYVSHELNKDAKLQYNDTTVEEYVIVIDESKSDFIKDYADADTYDSKMSPEKNYRMVQMKTMGESMMVKSGPNIKPAKINGLDAEVVDMVAKVDGIDSDIYYKMAFVEGTTSMYWVMSWTLADDKDKNNAEMDAMLNSFKLAK